MATALLQELREEEVVDIFKEPVVTLGNHLLRARQNRVDYCETKDKPELLYRLVPASESKTSKAVKLSSDGKQSSKHPGNGMHRKHKTSKSEPVVQEHVPVQLPEQVEPWPVWVRHSDKGLIAYGLWVNAAEMMKDPDVPGRFLMCADHKYKPVPNAEPGASAKLTDKVELMRPSNYRQVIKLGKAYQFASGQTFEEGEAILKVLQFAWPPGARPAKAWVGDTYLTPCSKPHRIGFGPCPRVMPSPPEFGEPVRVHVTFRKTKTTVYGLWTNAQWAIEACQPAPLMFVQCTGDTYQPIDPEVKCRNDRFCMLTGLPSAGGWRGLVKLDQQLSIPDGPTFEPGTSIERVFRTLLKLKAEKDGATECAAGVKSEHGNGNEEAADSEGEHNDWDNGDVIVIDNSPKTKQKNSSSNNSGRAKKRPATTPAFKTAASPRKCVKGKHSETASGVLQRQGNAISCPAAQRQPCSKPAAAIVPPKPAPILTVINVKREKSVTEVGTTTALLDQDTQQQQVLVSLPPLSVDAQFDMDADSAKHVLTALNSLLRSLNYGEQQAKQLWKGYKKAFLSEGISRASTSRKQEWATNYLQLADAVSSGDTHYVCSILENLFGVIP